MNSEVRVAGVGSLDENVKPANKNRTKAEGVKKKRGEEHYTQARLQDDRKKS